MNILFTQWYLDFVPSTYPRVFQCIQFCTTWMGSLLSNVNTPSDDPRVVYSMLNKCLFRIETMEEFYKDTEASISYKRAKFKNILKVMDRKLLTKLSILKRVIEKINYCFLLFGLICAEFAYAFSLLRNS